MNTRVKAQVNIPTIEKYYIINEDGAIWSKRKGKYLKPTFNTSGYLYVLLSTPDSSSPDTKMYAIHRLVACKYIGQCPDGLETSHKDGDKINNHWTNLEYITHSHNIMKSYREHGRKPIIFPRHPLSDHTKELMSDAKKKRVRFIFDGMETIFDSIEDASLSLYTYRKKIYRCIHDNIPFSDKKEPNLFGWLSFVEEKQVA